MRSSDLLLSACQRLRDAGVETPLLDAKVLLCHALHVTREGFLARGDAPLTPEEGARFEALLARRLNREPVSRILNKREFWSLDFALSPETLDPRPDSETLIQAVLDQYPDRTRPLRILDLGTGTGCLLLTLLHTYPQATGVGVDKSPGALETAERNGQDLGVSHRCRFQLSHWFEKVDGTFDIIVSNPPYISTMDLPTLAPEVRDFDPHGALFAGIDGLDDYRQLMPHFAKHLLPEGYVFLEIGEGQEDPVRQLMGQNGLEFCALYGDIQGIPRCVVGKVPLGGRT